MERLTPVIQGTTVELIHQPEDREGARIIAAAVAARTRRRGDRIRLATSVVGTFPTWPI